MSIVNSDGLSLLVGDGATSESFTSLRGTEINRFEISQRLVDSGAIATDAWIVGGATTDRRVLIECNALATDEGPATRVRSLAISGLSGNFRLKATSAESFYIGGYITNYREVTQAGTIKRIQFRIESSAAVTVV
jgi:glutaminase